MHCLIPIGIGLFVVGFLLKLVHTITGLTIDNIPILFYQFSTSVGEAFASAQ